MSYTTVIGLIMLMGTALAEESKCPPGSPEVDATVALERSLQRVLVRWDQQLPLVKAMPSTLGVKELHLELVRLENLEVDSMSDAFRLTDGRSVRSVPAAEMDAHQDIIKGIKKAKALLDDAVEATEARRSSSAILRLAAAAKEVVGIRAALAIKSKYRAARKVKTKTTVTFDQINKALGIELFHDESIWDDVAGAVAIRLDWPKESETTQESSYRLYPEDYYRILNCRPYSCAFYADQGKPSTFSVMFANKGDAVSILTKDLKDKGEAKAQDKQIKDYKKAIAADAVELVCRLTTLLGQPVTDRMGQGQATCEVVRRWDWNGHAFLVASPKDEYVALRIVSTKSADEGGRSRVTDTDLLARAKTRVERRPNGDVVLKDIPMVNQGPKGYCVPATWERVLRYMGVPADMYVLAMAGQTVAGGGTSTVGIANGAKDAVTRGGRKLEVTGMKVEPAAVAKYIDRGLPIMWTMDSTTEYNDLANERTKKRAGMTDAAVWKRNLTEARKGQKPLVPDHNEGHMCMIIGYNKETGEVAVSDSWGPAFEVRWILGVEANQVSQGSMMVINF